MLRHIAVFALLFATPSFAEPADAPRLEARLDRTQSDPFVIAPDDCDASRFAHLVGQSYTLHQASLPAGAVVHGRGDRGVVAVNDPTQAPTRLTTLEFKPQRLNIVVDGAERILSVGCH